MNIEDDPRFDDWVALVRAMPALAQAHPGKHVLWSGELRGVFDTYEACLTAGYDQFGLDPFWATELRDDQVRSWARWLAEFDATNAEYASWDCAALARGMEARSGETEGLDPEGATARPAGTRPEASGAPQPQQPAPADDKRALSEISRRALTAEARVRELEEAAVQPEPVAFDIVLDTEQAEFLKQTIGDDDCVSPIRLQYGDGHSGHGLYVSLAEYPDEGSNLLAAGHPSAPVQPPVLPLTEEEITDIWAEVSGRYEGDIDMHEFARAIEAKVRGTGSVPPSANLDSEGVGQ